MVSQRVKTRRILQLFMALIIFRNFKILSIMFRISTTSPIETFFLYECARDGYGEVAIVEIGSLHGMSTIVMEMNRKLADYISNKMGVKVANCEIENIDCFKGYKFDVIYHRNVLSHLYDPLEVFNVLNAKLKEDGVLIFETGNFGRLRKL